MSILLNGNANPAAVSFNGNDVTEVIFNGHTVWKVPSSVTCAATGGIGGMGFYGTYVGAGTYRGTLTATLAATSSTTAYKYDSESGFFQSLASQNTSLGPSLLSTSGWTCSFGHVDKVVSYGNEGSTSAAKIKTIDGTVLDGRFKSVLKDGYYVSCLIDNDGVLDKGSTVFLTVSSSVPFRWYNVSLRMRDS